MRIILADRGMQGHRTALAQPSAGLEERAEPVPMVQGGRPTAGEGHGNASGVDAAVACLWAGVNDPYRVSSHWNRSVSKPEGATIGRSV